MEFEPPSCALQDILSRRESELTAGQRNALERALTRWQRSEILYPERRKGTVPASVLKILTGLRVGQRFTDPVLEGILRSSHILPPR